MRNKSSYFFIGAFCVALSTIVSQPTRAANETKIAKPKKSEKPTAPPIAIADLKRGKPVNFEAEILPVLRRNCIACHNGTKAENHLVLETPQTILKGGDSSAGVVVGKSAESLLLRAAAHLEDPIMPPPDNTVKAMPLTPDELGLIKLWIDQGATGQVTGAATPLHWQKLPPTVNPILSLAVSPDGGYAACGRANEIFIYHISTGATVGRLVDPSIGAQLGNPPNGAAHLDIVQAMAFDPTGDLLASGGYREVKLWRRPRNAKLADLAGSTDAIRSVAVRPDGKQAATGEVGGGIKLWELPSGKLLQSSGGHTAAVTGLRFSPDGAKLFSGSLDKTLRAWNTADGKQIAQLDTPAPINAITLAGAATQICSGHADNTVRVWTLGLTAPNPFDPTPATPPKPPAPLKELKGHTGPVTALETLQPEGKEIVSGSEDGALRQWNTDSGGSARQLSHGAPITAIAARGDGKRFASAGATNSIKLWNLENQQTVELRGDFRTLVENGRLDRGVEVARAKSAREKLLIAETETRLKQETDAVQKAKDMKTASEKSVVEKTAAAKPSQDAKAAVEKEAEAAALVAKQAADKMAEAKAAADKDANNKDLAKASEEAKRLAMEADKKLADVKRRVDEATKAAKAPQQEIKRAEGAVQAAIRGIESAEQAVKQATDAVPAAKKSAELADVTQKQAEALAESGKKKFTDQVSTTRALAFSPDGLYLTAAGDNKLVQTWASDDGEPVDTFAGPAAPIQAIAWTSGGGIISGAADKTVVLWNTKAPWTLERTIGNPDDPTKLTDRVLALDFSPDGKMLATGGGEPSRSGELKLWNPADGALIRAIPDAHSDTIFSVRFSPDGLMLASSGADRFVKVFTVASGALVKAFEGHTHHVLGVAWQSDGKGLASGGADNVVKIWDVAAGEQRRTIEGFGKEVTAVAFSASTPRVVTTSGDRNVRMINADNGNTERNFGGAADFLYTLAVTPDGKKILAGGQDSVLHVWNMDTGQEIRHIDAPK